MLRLNNNNKNKLKINQSPKNNFIILFDIQVICWIIEYLMIKLLLCHYGNLGPVSEVSKKLPRDTSRHPRQIRHRTHYNNISTQYTSWFNRHFYRNFMFSKLTTCASVEWAVRSLKSIHRVWQKYEHGVKILQSWGTSALGNTTAVHRHVVWSGCVK
jgi:hypothetical protein